MRFPILSYSSAALFVATFFCVPAYADVPGGITAGYAAASGAPPATSFHVTLQVVKDPGPVAYFFAQEFWLNTATDHGGYFGLQGDGEINGTSVGKMLIFSIWNATSAEAGPNAVAVQFGGEGIGFSIRQPFPWQASVAYSFSLARESNTGWRLTVHSSSGDSIDIGRIDVEETATLETQFVNFVEYYGDLPSCAALPAEVVTFSNLTYGPTIAPFTGAIACGRCQGYGAARVLAPHVNTHMAPDPDVVFYDRLEF